MSRLSRTKPGVLNSGQYDRGTWGATVPGTYPTPEAGTCTPYVQNVGPGVKPPCASGTYPTRLVRVARTYPTEAPGRTCQLSFSQNATASATKGTVLLGSSGALQ